jgi:hypothetical protein
MFQHELPVATRQQSATVRFCHRFLVRAPVVALAVSICATARGETVQLHWSAPPACPEQSRFESEVRARTSNATFAEAPSGERLFDVALVANEGRFIGRLQIQEGSEPPATRTFEGDTCAEVVSALALVTALAIDPEASSGPIEELAALAVAPPIAPKTPPAPPVPPAVAPPPRALSHSDAPSLWQVGVGGRFTVEGWVAPRPLLGFDVFAEVWREERGPFTPGLRLGLGGAGSSTDEARWRWYVARIDACPVRAKVGWRLSNQTCAGVEVGALHGEGLRIASPHASLQPWVAARLTSGLLVDVSALYAGLDVGVVVPMTRYRFHFDHPWTEVHSVPPAGAAIEFFVGARLP